MYTLGKWHKLSAALDIFEWKLGLDEREIFSIFSLMWSTVTTSDA